MPSKIYIALPVMNEMERLPLLIQAIQDQSVTDFTLVVCINQPESWWNDPDHWHICVENQQALKYLKNIDDKRIEILDRSSSGLGWPPKGLGIGFARKFLMDHISGKADATDIIISMDADTVFGKDYFYSVSENLRLNQAASAISIPYYHRLSYQTELDRAMLRYEIYMRAYAVNMWRIRSPYCFTALGSAMAFPVWAYRAVGGMTPKMSGEDFYFLQKIAKSGRLLHWNNETVFPATRLSDRVFFGTGPALIKGIVGDWRSYPIYEMQLFDQVAETCGLFGQLYKKDIATPMDDFLKRKSGYLPWQALRQNFKTQHHFVRACNEKIDGLRILQFLKESQPSDEKISESSLSSLLKYFHQLLPEIRTETNTYIDFQLSTVAELDRVRNILFEIEMYFRRMHWNDFTGITSLYN